MSQKVDRVVIFGASGFVGQAVSLAISQSGIVSNHLSSKELNLLSKSAVNSYFSKLDTPGTSIVLCAARTPYSSNPQDDFEVMFENVTICRNIISALQRTSCFELIFLSTVDVYGINDDVISESTLLNPGSNYAASKASGELMLRSFANKNKIPLLILRLSQVYGKKDNSPKLIPSLLRSASLNKKMVIAGKGEILRDYVHVDDVASIVNKAIGKKMNSTVNVATGTSITINAVAQIIKRALTDSIEIVHEPATKREYNFRFNSSKVKSLFEFDFVNFEKELSEIVRAYDNQGT